MAEKPGGGPICYENPFCPVSINIWEGIRYTKCPATLRNPLCLTCARAHFIKRIDDGYKLACPYNCCESELPSINEVFRLYGEPTRKKNDPADIYTWGLLNAYGVLNRVCPRCNIECADLESVIDHNRKVCSERLIPCKKCNVLVKFKNIDAHKEEFGDSHFFKIHV